MIPIGQVAAHLEDVIRGLLPRAGGNLLVLSFEHMAVP